jgi:N-acetyl sugar amidotransferase
MIFCKHCVMPNTKPDLTFNEEGVCNACSNFENREVVDWEKRKNELQIILDKYRSKDGAKWDCIIPVSGGKDSTFQVLKMLEFGMNPLCITSSTCHLSDIGRANIENLKNLGVDHLEFSPNPLVRKKLNRIGLINVGDISWPEHVGIFTIPVQMSVRFNIPLLIWGENSQNEYGGPAAAADNNVLNRRWLEEFGGLLGMRVTDLIGQENIGEKDIISYKYPSDEELQKTGTTGLFLGHYISWNGLTNSIIAQANGFTPFSKPVETTFLNYENLDNLQAGIHDYFKFLKFGFGRATDMACLYIRRGYLSREEARKIVNKTDGKFPATYLDKPLEEILAHIDMSVEEFVKICDKFTNKKLFKTDSRGNLVKEKDGSLIKLFHP